MQMSGLVQITEKDVSCEEGCLRGQKLNMHCEMR